MTNSTADILSTVTRYADAWAAGNLAAIRDSYHDDFTLHYPGYHALAGTHSGKAAALAVLADVGRRTNRQLLEIVSVMAGDTRGAIVARERWQAGDTVAEVERVLVYAVRDGLLAECWLYDADQTVVAQFLN